MREKSSRKTIAKSGPQPVGVAIGQEPSRPHSDSLSLGDHGRLSALSTWKWPSYGYRRELPRPAQKFRRVKINFMAHCLNPQIPKHD
jgi:hypothetical protein